ncbi:DJ-1/PfpI family protein [Kitasatospora sp. HPMI-4]|uniref:DJ-1/PfpI family protein n=1 Tax=Kitasatospora sp. HPMI-4 TaxID=3448443 RepID=UPI003F1AEF4E
MRTDVIEVVLLAYPQVDELDLFGGYSVLAKAASLSGESSRGPRLDVRIVASEPQVTGSGGVRFAVDDGLDAAATAGVVVVPGGRGAQNASAEPELTDLLRAADARGAAIYAVCSGALLVAGAGLARERRIAVHHTKGDLLRSYPVGEVAQGLVRDGRIRSVGGDPSTSVKSVDLAFQILADFAPELVEPVSTRMETTPGRVLANDVREDRT